MKNASMHIYKIECFLSLFLFFLVHTWCCSLLTIGCAFRNLYRWGSGYQMRCWKSTQASSGQGQRLSCWAITPSLHFKMAKGICETGHLLPAASLSAGLWCFLPLTEGYLWVILVCVLNWRAMNQASRWAGILVRHGPFQAPHRVSPSSPHSCLVSKNPWSWVFGLLVCLFPGAVSWMQIAMLI